MSEISDKTLKEAYKPYDIVSDKDGNVGFIYETNMNDCQPEGDQISYAVEWLFGKGEKSAWYYHSELTRHCNLFVKIAECSCHPFGNNKRKVERLMGTGI